jgi:hypothetical protein
VVKKSWLAEALYAELAAIYIRLRDLLPNLDVKGSIELEERPANLLEFVNAESFNVAKSSPQFGQLKAALAIMQAHTYFSYLAVPERRD